MTARIHRLPTAPGALVGALEASVANAKRAKREQTLAHVRRLRLEATEKYTAAIGAHGDAFVAMEKAAQLYRTAIEIEECARHALENDK